MDNDTQEMLLIECQAKLSAVATILANIECPIIQEHRDGIDDNLKLIHQLLDTAETYCKEHCKDDEETQCVLARIWDNKEDDDWLQEIKKDDEDHRT